MSTISKAPYPYIKHIPNNCYVLFAVALIQPETQAKQQDRKIFRGEGWGSAQK
jgi:hypothetical protein